MKGAKVPVCESHSMPMHMPMHMPVHMPVHMPMPMQMQMQRGQIEIPCLTGGAHIPRSMADLS